MDPEDAKDAAAVAAAYLELPKRQQVIDVTTSASTLPASLDLADRLYRTLEDRGHRVIIAGTFEPFALNPIDRGAVIFGGSHPRMDSARRRPTVAYVGQMPFGLAVLETSIETTLRYAGFGRFLSEKAVEEVAARRGQLAAETMGPMRISSVPWRQEWSESRSGLLAMRVGTVAGISRRSRAAWPTGARGDSPTRSRPEVTGNEPHHFSIPRA
ncbi:hypothetical protein [Rhizobium sp. RHZ01]|uniref:hypothetical protein n=1 Tax=Rhizobium sp. RHZ01 TaxID=2769304 RepID=UPI00177C5EBB|nr:hypothetical protein [Rhizobium sp. RHZ01]MBD9447331.1 hypothetical protein [Rhizobium sp. RHZ01]